METQRMRLTKGNVKSDPLPLDVMMEILKRLSVKTLIRLLSVSKQWASIIRSRDFMKLFLNVSLTRPRGLTLLFRHGYCGLYFPSVLSQDTYEASPLTTFHVSCHSAHWTTVAPSVHGLICYGDSNRLVIYNPCTRRSITLPEIDTWRRPITYCLGHDPIDNDYKVLSIMTRREIFGSVQEIRVLTVGTGNSWKKIENNIIPPHYLVGQDQMCIGGVLYYRACTGIKLNDFVIMSFDVRSEKLYPIKGPCTFGIFWRSSAKLTSYEGKLAIIFCEKDISGSMITHLCVLVDAAKEQWSNKTFALPRTFMPAHWGGRFHTTETDTGEIVFAPTFLHGSIFKLVYYDLKTSSAKKVNIQRMTESTGYSESVSSNLVENLMFL